MAVTAAVCEMLVQSHIMGTIHLLPALPSTLEASGSFAGIRTRGGGKIALSWSHGNIDAVVIDIRSYHPWWGKYTEISAGFFNYIRESSESTISIISPNELVLVETINQSCVTWEEIETYQMLDFASLKGRKSSGKVKIRSYPCSIQLCSKGYSLSKCNHTISSLIQR